jgi:hypothetical protein
MGVVAVHRTVGAVEHRQPFLVGRDGQRAGLEVRDLFGRPAVGEVERIVLGDVVDAADGHDVDLRGGLGHDLDVADVDRGLDRPAGGIDVVRRVADRDLELGRSGAALVVGLLSAASERSCRQRHGHDHPEQAIHPATLAADVA